MNQPNDRINQLRQWMDAAREFGVGGSMPYESPTIGTGLSRRSQDANSIASMQRAWAERMMGNQGGGMREAPDFFSDNQVPMPQMEQRPMRQPMQSPMRPQIDNYLARLLGGMNGR